jgi:hypothetical protein
VDPYAAALIVVSFEMQALYDARLFTAGMWARASTPFMTDRAISGVGKLVCYSAAAKARGQLDNLGATPAKTKRAER